MPRPLDAARALHASGWQRAARLLARSVLLFDRRDFAALRLLFTWAIEAGDYGEAEKLCRRMLEAAPEEAGPLWDLAQLQLLRGAVPEALVQFQRHCERVAGPGY